MEQFVTKDTDETPPDLIQLAKEYVQEQTRTKITANEPKIIVN